MDTDATKLSLDQVWGVLRRHTPWIILCVSLAGGAAYAFSRSQARVYTATATLVFNNNQQAQQVAGLPVVYNSSPQAQQNTNVKLVQLGDMAAKTAALLGRGLTRDQVAADLSVSPQGESNIVNVSATASSPLVAAAIANTYTNQFVSEQQNTNHAYYASALRLVNNQLAALSPRERASAAGLALQDRVQSLGVLAELRNGNVQIAQAATAPTSPSGPKIARNTFLGLALGLLLGVSAAFVLQRFDRRIREPRDLEAIYGLPLLGVVPESAALSRSGRGKQRRALPANEEEAFHLIRAHLRYFNVDRELRTLLVASAAPRDGKTTVARHLAGAAARVGSRVLLLEADLRRPTFATQMDVATGPGLSDVLIGATSLHNATQIVALAGPRADDPAVRTLDVITAGAALPPNPGELLESHAMESLLDCARMEYDLVVIDTPPLTAVSDAFPLLRKVDGVVIVGRVGQNRRDIADRLHTTLTGAGAPLLGVVANGFKARVSNGYGYGYGYEYSRGTHVRSSDAEPSHNGASSTEESYPAVET